MSNEIAHDETPTPYTEPALVVYEPYFINFKQLAQNILYMYKADRIKRPDELKAYVEKCVRGVVSCNVVRATNGSFYVIKMKTRDSAEDVLYWNEFRVSVG